MNDNEILRYGEPERFPSDGDVLSDCCSKLFELLVTGHIDLLGDDKMSPRFTICKSRSHENLSPSCG